MLTSAQILLVLGNILRLPSAYFNLCKESVIDEHKDLNSAAGTGETGNWLLHRTPEGPLETLQIQGG